MEEKVLINWSDNYSVGYAEIDEQHKKLVEMINTLYFSFTQGDADKIIEPILNEMIQYTDYHFKIEEEYFEKYNYPGKQEHKIEHQHFVEKISTFHNDYKSGSITVSYEIMDFLKDWLISHIKTSDKKYSNYFKNQNMSKL
ncbi:MAG: bacteriohemerythrin [Salinivirgaceae bacterium]|jgi:hemerythrin